MAARRRWLPGEYRYDVDIRLGDFIRLACENATSAGAAGQRLRITCTRPLPAAYSSFSRSRLGRLDSSSSAAPVCPAYTHTQRRGEASTIDSQCRETHDSERESSAPAYTPPFDYLPPRTCQGRRSRTITTNTPANKQTNKRGSTNNDGDIDGNQ